MKPTNRKTLKKTPWFSGVNPLRSRPGWYKANCYENLIWWSGEYWLFGTDHLYRVNHIYRWRGVSR